MRRIFLSPMLLLLLCGYTAPCTAFCPAQICLRGRQLPQPTRDERRGDAAPDPESLQGPMDLIEQAAGSAVRPNNAEQLNNGLYPLPVTELYRGDRLCRYRVFINIGKDRGWRDADWMKFDFAPLYCSSE